MGAWFLGRPGHKESRAWPRLSLAASELLPEPLLWTPMHGHPQSHWGSLGSSAVPDG